MVDGRVPCSRMARSVGILRIIAVLQDFLTGQVPPLQCCGSGFETLRRLGVRSFIATSRRGNERPDPCRWKRGNSSVGRAQPCQGWGREFESRFPLQTHGRNPAQAGFAFRPAFLAPTLRRNFIDSAAGWQSGYAAACKAVYARSIRVPASNLFRYLGNFRKCSGNIMKKPPEGGLLSSDSVANGRGRRK